MVNSSILESYFKYELLIPCYERSEGFEQLSPFVSDCTDYFKILGAILSIEEVWKDNEGDKMAPWLVGYDITVTFQGQYTLIAGFGEAAVHFFNLYNAVKTDEKLYLIEKHSK